MPSDVRLVLDTNTVVSALLWRGKPHTLVEATRTRPAALFTSPTLLAELADVLTRGKLAAAIAATRRTPPELFQRYRRLTTVIHPEPIPPTVSDPDDDHVIACALSAKADLLVSGDRALLVLNPHQGIAIVTAAEALALLAVPK